MTGMNNTDYQLFAAIAKMKQNTLLRSMRNYLKKYYEEEKIIATKDYILCEGDAPIMLVAHMDTVFKQPPTQIYYDQKKHVMWSPQGLGADDRAGVFAIMKIIQNGYRPHICLTTDEECGGIGAQVLVSNIKKAPFDIKYIVQLDRQGICDCVFYSCDNQKFQEFIEYYDFMTDWGTFSDISIICPAWQIAGVNISVGYFNEHNLIETLHTDALYSTIKKVQKMIDEIDNASYFEYVCARYMKYWNWNGLDNIYGWDPLEDDDLVPAPYSYSTYPTGPYQCTKCKRFFSGDDIFLVKSRENSKEKKYYCVDCVGEKINWCDKCGEPFEANKPNESLCPDCANIKE